jgi:hypothetical protein
MESGGTASPGGYRISLEFGKLIFYWVVLPKIGG